MSNNLNKPPFNQPETNPTSPQEKAGDSRPKEQTKANRNENPPSNQAQSSDSAASAGMGSRIAGAAVGGLLGARAAGFFGAVAGSVAGVLIGKGTADTVNRTVDHLGDAANTRLD